MGIRDIYNKQASSKKRTKKTEKKTEIMKLLKTFIIFAASSLAQPVGQEQISETTDVDQPGSQMQNDAVSTDVVYGNEWESDTEEPIEEPEEEPEEEPVEEPEEEAADQNAPTDDSPAATEDGKTSVEANADESDDAADETPAETPVESPEEPVEEPEEEENDESGEFSTQSVKTTLTVGEKAHNMCELADVDQNTYRCDETEDEFLRCTATCPNGSGIIKQNCECYKYFGPLVLYDPENCIWNNFEDECFDEDPIPVGGYPASSDDAETCENCALEAEQIAEEPVPVEDEETENPRFMQPVKIVSSDEADGNSWFAAEDLDDQAHFSGFLRHLDRWAKLTLVAVEQGEMQPVMYQQL